MSMEVTSGPASVSELTDTGEDSSAYIGQLSAYSVLVTAPPSQHDYSKLLDRGCETLRPALGALSRNGYAEFVFMAGARLSREKRAGLKAYDLAKPLRQQGVNATPVGEKDFALSNNVQSAALYRTVLDEFGKVCNFLTHYGQSIAILSARSRFASDVSVKLLYEVAGYMTGTSIYEKPRWLALGGLLAPKGDIIVKTHGSFDDKHRRISFLFAPGSAAESILASPD